MLFKEIVKPVIICYIEQMPIIKPGTFQLSIIYLKSERTYKVKRTSGCGACAGNISRILRNFGLKKHNVQTHFMFFRSE